MLKRESEQVVTQKRTRNREHNTEQGTVNTTDGKER